MPANETNALLEENDSNIRIIVSDDEDGFNDSKDSEISSSSSSVSEFEEKCHKEKVPVKEGGWGWAVVIGKFTQVFVGVT